MKKLLLLGLLLISAVSLRAMEYVDNNGMVSVETLINDFKFRIDAEYKKAPALWGMLQFSFTEIERCYKSDSSLVVPQNLYEELDALLADSISAKKLSSFMRKHGSAFKAILENKNISMDQEPHQGTQNSKVSLEFCAMKREQVSENKKIHVYETRACFDLLKPGIEVLSDFCMDNPRASIFDEIDALMNQCREIENSDKQYVDAKDFDILRNKLNALSEKSELTSGFESIRLDNLEVLPLDQNEVLSLNIEKNDFCVADVCESKESEAKERKRPSHDVPEELSLQSQSLEHNDSGDVDGNPNLEGDDSQSKEVLEVPNPDGPEESTLPLQQEKVDIPDQKEGSDVSLQKPASKKPRLFWLPKGLMFGGGLTFAVVAVGGGSYTSYTRYRRYAKRAHMRGQQTLFDRWVITSKTGFKKMFMRTA